MPGEYRATGRDGRPADERVRDAHHPRPWSSPSVTHVPTCKVFDVRAHLPGRRVQPQAAGGAATVAAHEPSGAAQRTAAHAATRAPHSRCLQPTRYREPGQALTRVCVSVIYVWSRFSSGSGSGVIHVAPAEPTAARDVPPFVAGRSSSRHGSRAGLPQAGDRRSVALAASNSRSPRRIRRAPIPGPRSCGCRARARRSTSPPTARSPSRAPRRGRRDGHLRSREQTHVAARGRAVARHHGEAISARRPDSVSSCASTSPGRSFGASDAPAACA